jgi:hypothetical protein
MSQATEAGAAVTKPGPLQVRVRTVGSLNDVSSEDWDALAARVGFYQSHSWLRSVEGHPHAEPVYILVEDTDGRLVAALPVYKVNEETNQRYDVRRLPNPGSYPDVVLGNRRGFRSALLLEPTVDREVRNAALGLLRAAMIDQVGHRPARFWYVPDSDLPSCLNLDGARCGTELGQDATVPIPRGGFEEYAAALPPRRRAKVRRERRVYLDHGYDTSLEPLAGIATEAGVLLHQLQCKYGSTDEADFYIGYYERLAAAADPGEMLTCRRNGRLLGACHFYIFGDGIWARSAGFDYANLENGFEYFNLGFYELLELGAPLGKRRLHMGMGSLDAKVRRGAQVESLWLVEVPSGRSPTVSHDKQPGR